MKVKVTVLVFNLQQSTRIFEQRMRLAAERTKTSLQVFTTVWCRFD